MLDKPCEVKLFDPTPQKMLYNNCIESHLSQFFEYIYDSKFINRKSHYETYLCWNYMHLEWL